MRRLSIELPESAHQQVKAQASVEGVSMREFVLRRLGVFDDESAAGDISRKQTARHDPANCSMRELIKNRNWRGTRTRAEIDAQVAEERAGLSAKSDSE